MVKLRSPRIVQVFGVVTTDSSWLGLVVEYCSGGDLRTALDADGAASIDEAQRRSWLSDIAMGLTYLYSKGVEHRDLKSLNVLLDGARRCKVTDFGLSKSEDLNTAATQSTMGGGAKGTPAYMAPELLDSNTFTEKTDVYAYGMIVFEVLTGESVARPQPDADHDAGVHQEGTADDRRRRARGPSRVDAEVLGPRAGRAADVRRDQSGDLRVSASFLPGYLCPSSQSFSKHIAHMRHIGHVPIIERLVEGGCG